MRLDVTGDPEIATRINSFEMAFRMQAVAPDLMDIAKEPKETLELYGAEPGKASFANNCLLARRLVEKGVRFVQLYHEAWDQHSQPGEGSAEELPGHRSRRRRADQGPQAPRPARRNAGDLGRRIRPHSDGARRHRRPRPPSQRLHHVDGRRRHQSRRAHRRDRRTRLQRRPATRSTCTTCTPPCSSCWASTTLDLPTNSRAAISGLPTSPARSSISSSHSDCGLIPRIKMKKRPGESQLCRNRPPALIAMISLCRVFPVRSAKSFKRIAAHAGPNCRPLPCQGSAQG